MLQVSWSIEGRCLSKLFKDFLSISIFSIYSFQNLQWKAKLQVNPYVLSSWIGVSLWFRTMTSLWLVVALIILIQWTSLVEAWYRPDPNTVGYAEDRWRFYSLSLSSAGNITSFLFPSSCEQEDDLGRLAPYGRGSSMGDRLGVRRPLCCYCLRFHQVWQGGF